MKRFISLLVVMIMAVSFAGCGEKESGAENVVEHAVTEEVEETVEEVEELIDEALEEEVIDEGPVSTEKGYVTVTLSDGWYVGEPKSNGALTLFHKDMSAARWIDIVDVQLSDYDQMREITQLALSSSEYEEITIGNNTYEMLYSDSYGQHLMYLIAETSTGKAFCIEVRGASPDEAMPILETIEIH